jgi:hypothetical protein
MASGGGGAMAADPLQGIFIERLGVEPEVAIRIFGQIQTMYSAQIAQAEPSDLVYPVVAKVWPASIFKQPVQEHACNATAHLERLGWH